MFCDQKLIGCLVALLEHDTVNTSSIPTHMFVHTVEQLSMICFMNNRLAADVGQVATNGSWRGQGGGVLKGREYLSFERHVVASD